MQILEDLYLGDVRPGERSGSRNRQHVKALDELLKAEEELSASLSEEQRKLFEAFTDAQREVSILTDAETFTYSFKPETEWYTVENTHEGIIPEEVFRQAQELIQSRRRPQKDGTTQIFSGLLKCPDCGWTMSYATNKQGKEPYGYFTCTTHRMYGKMNNACTCHYVRYDVLYIYVLSRIQYWVKRVEEDEEHLLEMLLKAGDQEHAAATKKQTTELKKAEKRKAELDSMFAKMYEDWASGRITESNFDMLTKKYQSEQETVEQKIQALKAALAEEKETVENAEKWIALIKECGKPTELTAELLNTLIEKILVHEAWKDETHTRHQEIEIVYRFVGKID